MKMLLALLLLLAVPASALFGQSDGEHQARYDQIQQILVLLDAQIDSLNGTMTETAGEIDIEKQKSDVDKPALTRLMARGLTIGQEIRALQKRRQSLNNESNRLGLTLSEAYSQSIDSLRRRMTRIDEPLVYDAHERQLITLTEKYLAVSPAFRALTFDPRQLNELSLEAADDSISLILYRDYLGSAMADIDTHLGHIRDQRRELERTVKLQRKTSEFLEEIEDGYLRVVSPTEALAADAAEGNFANSPTTLNTEELDGVRYATHARSIFLFFDQLSLKVPKTMQAAVDGSDAPLQFSAEDYINLLRQAEKRLEEYQRLVQLKLKVQ